ncbi:MAG: dihydroorotase family protein [Solirubrobacteraceae bacterium]|nr:dihydroorotase family protein [Solirubrobacteraceae bacterium]
MTRRGAAADLAIRGGTVVTPDGRRELDVLIGGERIAALVPPDAALEGAAVIDARGCFVLPGMIDSHVHFMDPGDPRRESFPAGTAAAARQGVTTVIEHTHQWPVNTVARLRRKREHLRGRARVDYGLAAHVWPDRIGALGELWRAGAAYFKAFTCNTHGVPAIEGAALLELGRAVSALDAPCLVHCEDELITARNERRLRAAGRTGGVVVAQWRSREAERAAASAVADVARATGARFVVAHASSADVLDALAAARSAGSPVLAECCPQYLVLHESEAREQGALRKFTPPARIRDARDERRLWSAFNAGLIHHISSDHAPSTRRQKLAGDIWEAPFGLPGIDTTLPLMLDAALSNRTTLERVVEAYAAAPARAYGIAGKGRLEVGAIADVAVVDPAGVRELRDADVLSRAGWTPYAGMTVRGRVVHTLLRGAPVLEDGELVDEAPRGRFVPGAGYAAGDRGAARR